MSASSLSFEKKLIDDSDKRKAITIRVLSATAAFFALCAIALSISLGIVYNKSECSLHKKGHSRVVVIGSLRQTFHQVEAYAIMFYNLEGKSIYKLIQLK